jgi:hypothetical protein
MLYASTHNTEPQPRRQVLKKNTIFVGLDVHKNSIDVALADAGHDGDIRFYGSIGGDLYLAELFFDPLLYAGLPRVSASGAEFG